MQYPAFESYLNNQRREANRKKMALAAVFVLAIMFFTQFFYIVNAVACHYGPDTGSLTVTKVVVNDNGGTATVPDFKLNVSGQSVVSGESNDFKPGDYKVGECGGPTGYQATYSGDCDSDGNISIEAGNSYSCTITNNDQPGILHVKKIVINDDGGTKSAQDFSFTVNGGESVAFEADGQNDLTLPAGTYDVSEPSVKGYSASYDNCKDINLANGGEATCTITNNDKASAPKPKADISVQKSVDNNNPQSGQNVTFSVVVADLGPDGALSVQLNDLLPAGLSFVSASSTKGNYDSASGVWIIGDMTKDESETLQIVATANGEAGAVIENCAEITDGIDPCNSNNKSCVSLTITASPAPSPTPSPASSPSPSPSPAPSPTSSPSPSETPSSSPNPSESPVPSPEVNPVIISGGNGPILPSNAYANWVAQQAAAQTPPPLVVPSPAPVPQGQVKGVTTLPSTGFDLTELVVLVTMLLTAGLAMFIAKRELILNESISRN